MSRWAGYGPDHTSPAPSAADRLHALAVKLVGPALPFARTTADPAMDYIPLVLAQSRKPDAISFHGYAWADNETPDLVAYTGDPTNRARRGLADILADVPARLRRGGGPFTP